MLTQILIAAAEPLNYDAMDFWFKVFQFLWSIGVLIYVWWSNRDKARAAAILAVDEAWRKSHKELEKAVGDLQSDVKHLPSRDDMRRIWESIDRINSQMAKIDGTLTAAMGALEKVEGMSEQLGELRGTVTNTRRAVESINDYLLNRKPSL